MVGNVLSLTNNGLRDWLVQRVTAVILAVYTVFLLTFILLAMPVDYETWHHLFANHVMKIATLLTLLSVMLHAWVGMWTVLTDYVKPMSVRIPLMTLIILSFFAYLIWGILIVWGV